MSFTRLWRWTALAMALSLSACLRSNDGVDTSPEGAILRESAASAELLLEVVNRSTHALDLYVMRGGSRFRIGDARPISTASITVPSDLILPGGVTFLAVTSPGGIRIASPSMNARRGNTVVFEISADLRSSRAYVQ